jgi:hypothetical protein
MSPLDSYDTPITLNMVEFGPEFTSYGKNNCFVLFLALKESVQISRLIVVPNCVL